MMLEHLGSLTIKVTRSLSVGKVVTPVDADDFRGLHEGPPKSSAGERDIRVAGLAADILKALLLELDKKPTKANPLLFPAVEGGYLQPRILSAEFETVVHQIARYPFGREFERWVCPDMRPGEPIRQRRTGEQPREYPDSVVNPTVCKRCGTCHLHATVHSLRHTAISRWVNEQEVTVWAAAKRAGHKSVFMVVETYSHSTDEADKSVALKDEVRHKGLDVTP